ncbi:MAG: hypothetical protein ILO34_03025 [Kiritimatiellae bacterium]|nr:hypothetical protein [Kiritimatiellia bacterium]
MKSLIPVFALAAAASAAVVDLANFNGTTAKGDTVRVSSSSVLRIDEAIALNLPEATLLVSAKDGVVFGSNGSISLSGNSARLVLDADADADGKGSVACDAGRACVSVAGKGAIAKIFAAGDLSESVATAGNGASARVYSNLYSAAELAATAARVNAENAPERGWAFALAKDVDMSETDFEPMRGALSADGKSRAGFSGAFDGRGHRVSGLSLRLPSEENVGLFGLTANATIERIAVVDAEVSGWAGVGALVGYLGAGSVVRECLSSGRVIGNYQVGGLVGEAYRAALSDVRSEAKVAGTRFVGGTVGFVGLKSSVERALSTGDVEGDEVVGAVAGRNRFGAISGARFRSSGDGVGSCLQGECEAVALGESALTDESNFPGWAFGKVWAMGAAHPELAAFGPVAKAANDSPRRKENSDSDADLWETVPEGMHWLIVRDASGKTVGKKAVQPGQRILRALFDGKSVRFAK